MNKITRRLFAAHEAEDEMGINSYIGYDDPIEEYHMDRMDNDEDQHQGSTKLTATIRHDGKGWNELPDENQHVIMGGDSSNPTWDAYLAQWKEEWQPHILAIREAINEHGLRRSMGGAHANNTWFLVDGHGFTFSWRAWGDLIQAIENKQEGYMAYYM